VKTEENLKEITLLRKELSPRMQFLKKQMERVERAFSLRDELAAAAREYFAREKFYFEHEKESLQTGGKVPQKELGEIERKVKEIRGKIEGGEGRGESEKLLSLEQHSRELREKKDVLSRKLGRVEGMIELESSYANALENKREEKRGEAMIPMAKVREFSGIIKGLLDEALGREEIEHIKETLARLKEKIAGFIASVEEKYTTHDESREEVKKNSREAALLALQKEKEEMIREMGELELEEQRIMENIDALRKISEKKREAGHDAEKELFALLSRERELSLALEDLRRREDDIAREEKEWKAELAEVVVRAGKEAMEFEGLTFEDSGEAGGREIQKERKKKLERMKIRLEELGVGGGDDIVKEFEEVSERDLFLAREIGDLEASAESLKKIIDDLHDKLTKQFEDGLQKINRKFQDFFALMFGGGTAHLSLIFPKKEKAGDPNELSALSTQDLLELGVIPEEQTPGLEIALSLPQKKLRGIQMLSGGERTLVSIALLFAVSQVNPPPFLVLDETDAALDEANAKKYADMLANLSATTQLLIITHNRETMSRAGIIYGITADSSAVSQVLSIKFEDAEGMMAR
ncbi:hypothetical protein L0Y69_01395, partial [bacterium]|nr:hypothetical protein [bacterium]